MPWTSAAGKVCGHLAACVILHGMRHPVLGLTMLASMGLLLAGCGRAPLPPKAPAPSETEDETDAAKPAAFLMQGQTNAGPKFRLPCFEDDPIGCTNACNDGVTEDCVTLGGMYLDGGAVIRRDRERAVDLFRGACTGGSARGCMKLGDVYFKGVALPPDPVEAVALYRKACDAGANQGCLVAGKAYVEGRGVGVDPVFGASLFARVCERGNAQACFELGQLYDRGDGVRKDPTRAVVLFTKACQLGLDEGCLIASRAGEVLPPRN